MSKPKFKVGDKVLVTNDKEKLILIGCPSSYAGQKGEVAMYKSDAGDALIRFFDGESWWVTLELLKNISPEKPKYYSGKVVCIDSKTSSFTKGKIYVVTNGILNSNDGVYECYRFTSFADIQGTLASKFIELVE